MRDVRPHDTRAQLTAAMKELLVVLLAQLLERPFFSAIRRLLTTPRRKRFEAFAASAFRTGSGRSIRIKIKHTHALVEAIIATLDGGGNFNEDKFWPLIKNGLSLVCLHCGVFNNETKSLAITISQGGLLSTLTYVTTDPGAALLARGRCPGCRHRSVTAILDPKEYR